MLCLFRAELGVPGVEELAFLVVVLDRLQGSSMSEIRLGSVPVLVGAGLVRLEQK